jgi:hypothetical protein
MNMKSGYHQVEIFEPHKERSAFTVGPLGFYEYTRMPFGMTNSPATYQRLMEDCLADYHPNPDASVCSSYGRVLSAYPKIGEDVSNRFKVSKAFI